MALNNPGSGSPKRPPRPANDIAISCRATNPISINDDLGKVFLDENQAKATTATRLFRNDEIFNAITKVVMPGFFSATRSKFAMWSTGCSSGEEVYSMAMIALTEIAKSKRSPLLEVFGTDINSSRIEEARSGFYGRPSRDAFTPNYWRILEKYAEIDSNSVTMGSKLRSICKFKLFDMRNCPKKHFFFFIVCNHVLQYYDSDGQQHILRNLKAVLNPGGFLYLEGITTAGLEGSGLVKEGSIPNLYVCS
ncbi:MAG: hypothetical protein LBU79_01975 [Planctomycetota bacterium]|jgi:chemotaxis methyl-accepting protein methylase|nr:hypothetical protein [Planctomycetota bacterium]